MPPSLPTKKKRSSAMLVDLEKKILAGSLKQGEQLPSEKDLEQEFGVSRTVVREALQHLKSRGMLESRRGSGTYVATPSRNTISDSISWYASLQRDGVSFLELMDLRILVETEAARLVASKSAPLTEISAQLRLMQKNVSKPESFAESDIGFHLAVIKTSEHSLFYVVAKGLLKAPSLSFARSTHAIDPTMAEKVLEEHRRIFHALEKRDPEAAAKATLDHLRNSRENLVASLTAALSISSQTSSPTPNLSANI